MIDNYNYGINIFGQYRFLFYRKAILFPNSGGEKSEQRYVQSLHGRISYP